MDGHAEPRRVLIVEDDHLATALTGEVLSEHGHAVSPPQSRPELP